MFEIIISNLSLLKSVAIKIYHTYTHMSVIGNNVYYNLKKNNPKAKQVKEKRMTP